jgi:hypothetical protein
VIMNSAIIVQDWDSDGFHKQVMDMESKGYVTRQESYRITAVMNPETGRISHVYRIEMCKPDQEE